jgi:hypothetical protein
MPEDAELWICFWGRSEPVDEATWRSCTDPTPMLEFLRSKGGTSDRKFRLFAVGCCRQLLGEMRVSPRDVHAVEVAERYADEEATATELDAAATYIPGPPSAHRTAAFACRNAVEMEAGAVMADAAAENAAWATGEHAASLAEANHNSPVFAAARSAAKAAQAALLRDLLGPLPFRPLPSIAAGVLRWNGGCIVNLATAIYSRREFTPERMGVLADTLEEAGCTDQDILGHLREPGAVHVRGCHLVDRILGKE